MSFNTDWVFAKVDHHGAEKPSFTDSDWTDVVLPHDWSIEGPFEENQPSGPRGGYAPGGIGWYRKRFVLPMDASNQNVFIQFDGIYMNSDVWINGHHLGNYVYGYTSFEYDLTPYLNKAGEENILAVRVDNSIQPGSRWYSGSGIYRPVRLVITSPLYVPQWGTFVTTPQVSATHAVVHIRTDVKNDSKLHKTGTILTRIRNANGEMVGEAMTPMEWKPSETQRCNQEVTVTHPQLWSLESPYLYTVESVIMDGDHCSDVLKTTVGIREAVFDSNRGFFLNGKNIKIKGVCLHHDGGSLGAACLRRTWERQIETLQAMGCNAIRTSHNPPSPEFLDLCDQMGMLVMVEAFDEWRIGKAPRVFTKDGMKSVTRQPIFAYYQYFDEWAERDITAMVERDRNHPSVILWSIGNEIMDVHEASGAEIAKMLRDFVRQADPTRPTTLAMNNLAKADKHGTPDIVDVAGYNYHERMYIEDHLNYPNRVILGSENRSGVPFVARGEYESFIQDARNNRHTLPVSADATQLIQGLGVGDMSASNACERYIQAQYSWAITDALDHVSGLFIWTGYDYIGEPTPYGWPSRSSYFGIIDLAGFPKDSYYLYQSLWSESPCLHLLPHWNWQGREGELIPVWCFSNDDGVELFLNGVSLGYQDRKDNRFYHYEWLVPYQSGTLKAVGYKNGQVRQHKEVHTTSEPYQIKLYADRHEIDANTQDLAYITVQVEDIHGNIVPTANHRITITVEGEGLLAGVDNGNPASPEPFQANHVCAFHGLGLAVIKNSPRQGEIKVSMASPGLQSVELILHNK
jgi:beta-galactosidase